MDAEGLGIVQREQSAAPEFEGFVNELLGGRPGRERAAVMAAKHSHDDFDIVLLEAVEAERPVRRVDFSVGADFRIAMAGGPLGDFGVVTLAVSHDRGQQRSVRGHKRGAAHRAEDPPRRQTSRAAVTLAHDQ